MDNKTEINITYKDFPIICRICLTKGDLQSFQELDLLDLFKSITNIEIESEDQLPTNVCVMCINQLVNISSFIRLSKENDEHLRQIVDRVKQSCTEYPVSDYDIGDTSESLDIFTEVDVKVKSEYSENSEVADNIKDELLVNPSKTKKNIEKSERHSTQRQASKCDICDELFDTKSKLSEHQRKNAPCRTRQHKCMHCEKAFYTKFRLTLHMRSHTKETPFECKICFRKFRQTQNLKRHDDIVHKGLKPHKCDVCGKEFARRGEKIQHRIIHTDERPYVCGYCGKSFKRISTHQIHITNHRIKNGELQDLSANECKICKKVFSAKHILQSHLETHGGEKKFLCYMCGRSFLQKGNLVAHFRIHTDERPFECKECGKKFRRGNAYKTHIVLHTGLRSFKCDVCLKTFMHSYHLKAHSKIHTGEKPYKCTICGKEFAHNSNLKIHERIHTGETPYHCPICVKGFHDLSNMKKHKKVHFKTLKSER